MRYNEALHHEISAAENNPEARIFALTCAHRKGWIVEMRDIHFKFLECMCVRSKLKVIPMAVNDLLSSHQWRTKFATVYKQCAFLAVYKSNKYKSSRKAQIYYAYLRSVITLTQNNVSKLVILLQFLRWPCIIINVCIAAVTLSQDWGSLY